MPARSRWSSAATPPETRTQKSPRTPAGVPARRIVAQRPHFRRLLRGFACVFRRPPTNRSHPLPRVRNHPILPPPNLRSSASSAVKTPLTPPPLKPQPQMSTDVRRCPQRLPRIHTQSRTAFPAPASIPEGCKPIAGGRAQRHHRKPAPQTPSRTHPAVPTSASPYFDKDAMALQLVLSRRPMEGGLQCGMPHQQFETRRICRNHGEIEAWLQRECHAVGYRGQAQGFLHRSTSLWEGCLTPAASRWHNHRLLVISWVGQSRKWPRIGRSWDPGLHRLHPMAASRATTAPSPRQCGSPVWLT